ncbi:N-acetyltransferase family protein [Fredinandcohnia humi]
MYDMKKIDCTHNMFRQMAALYQEVWDRNDNDILDRFYRHSNYEGYRGYIVINDIQQIIGFTYGYTSLPGQYYRGLLEKELNEEDTNTWLDNCFEFVELAVHPQFRKMGIGTGLATALLEGLPHKTAILTTQVWNDSARSLYKSLGWIEVKHTFLPDGKTPYVIMGKTLR